MLSNICSNLVCVGPLKVLQLMGFLSMMGLCRDCSESVLCAVSALRTTRA